MNSHRLPYPYHQGHRSPPFSGFETLADALYGAYLRFQPLAASPASTKPVQLVCISDTHNSTREASPGELLIHAGDLTQRGTSEELHSQFRRLSALPYTHKIVVAGNHDRLLDSDFVKRHPTRIPSPPGSFAFSLGLYDVDYLQDRSVTLEFPNGRRLSIYGSPQTPEFGIWAFPFQYPAIRDVWTGRIPDNTDIVVVHGPPVPHRDAGKKGDRYLLKELRRVRPQLVVFGHAHDGHGEDYLLHDGVQSAWEDAVLQRSGIPAILRMSFWMLVALLKIFLALPQPSPTRLVNAEQTAKQRSTLL
ncbi:phosphoesterase [Trichophyton equinum CBS 127.97]|uniref:Phosphoesterase n=1 Tax=Trichophyton equinum (strain ATCC MYA-4606 / CBS 127.97) TaxID=559882 RepID=F2Q0W6_TRIEC|nr:phosphoesterase [Trichophyton equinum CBS 127.97]